MRIQLAYVAFIGSFTQQVMVHGQLNLAAYIEAGSHQQVQCPAYGTFGGVFYRYHAIVNFASLYHAKYFVYGSALYRCREFAKLLGRSFFAEGTERAKESYSQ